MPETTFTDPDLTTFLGLDTLGLTAVGQHLTAERAVIECRMPIGFEDPFCKACGAQGVSRGTVARRLAHVPVGWRPTQLVVRVRRFACTHCCRVWRQDTSALAQPRARLTRSAVEWGLRALALECMSVCRVAAALGISWHTVRARREQLGLSQEKLAERTTLHWSYIGQVERGQRNLSLHNILRIAHALDTDAGGLVSGLEV